MSRLTEVFKRLRKANLKIQPDKCEFLRKEVAYLGHLVTENGVKTNPAKISCIKNFPEPKNTKEIKSFLGLAGYYRRFIPNFAKISKPLTKLLQKDVPFIFNSDCKEAFNELKNILTSDPILIYPNFEEPFLLTTYASAFAIGAVLSQGPIGKDLPIAYASRTLCGAETKYSTIERELLAIVWAVKHFRPYLFGRKFTLITDHRPLTWLFSIKDPGSRLARWRLKLEEYNYKIEHRAGKINRNADALSRIKINHFKDCANFQSKISLHASNEDDTETQENEDDDEENIEKMSEELDKFIELYRTKSIIDYSKIETSNTDLLDKSNKNIVTFFWQNKLEELHEKIMNDIFEENMEYSNRRINIVHSKTVKDRKYFIIPLPFDPERVISHLFLVLFANKDQFDESKIYCVENNLELPILEIFSYIFADKELKLRICQNIIKTASEDEIPQILDHYHCDADKIMAEDNDEVLACFSKEMPEAYSDSGSSYAPSLPNSSSAKYLNSSDESVNNKDTAEEDVERKSREILMLVQMKTTTSG
ncbi:uncharacterized protein [Diabrotica undecimpunctata]|uniref:uncharacterized protein n=1 Tax=Diabrotica undecimpunctata TaxID=50387 RepID=UPI003B6382FA